MEAEQSVLPKYNIVFPVCKSTELAPLLWCSSRLLHTYDLSFGCACTSDPTEPEIKILSLPHILSKCLCLYFTIHHQYIYQKNILGKIKISSISNCTLPKLKEREEKEYHLQDILKLEIKSSETLTPFSLPEEIRIPVLISPEMHL